MSEESPASENNAFSNVFSVVTKIIIVIGLTIIGFLTTCNLYDFPDRYGMTSEDHQFCKNLGAEKVISCRSQTFTKKNHSLYYLRAELIPTPERCYPQLPNLPEGVQSHSCPEGYTDCYAKSNSADSEKSSMAEYFLFTKNCEKGLYFETSGIDFEKLIQIDSKRWSREDEL